MKASTSIQDTSHSGYSTMKEFTRLSMALVSGFALFIMSAVNVAAAPTKELPNNQWTMISLPSDPGASASIRSIFADDLPANAYGSSGGWKLLSFNPSSGTFEELTLDSRLEAAKGYWIIQSTGSTVTLDMPADSSAFTGTTSDACPSPEGCVSTALISSGAPYTWNLVGRAGDSPLAFSSTRISANTPPCIDGCTPGEARSSLMLDYLLTYDNASGSYVTVNESDSLDPWAGYWAIVLPGASRESNAQWLQPLPPSGTGGTASTDGTNVSGGGFQSDVTISEDGQTIYSSADVSGVLKSVDGGLGFLSQNKGLESYKVASMAITPDNEQILYAGTGDKGGSAGLFRSNDGGESWARTEDGANAKFSGNHSAASDPVPNGHPRSNGDLIVVDQGGNPATHTDDIVIAGTYKRGVRLFTQGGDSEASAVNTSGFVRSVAHHPALPNIVYAAIQFANSAQNGIYKIDYTNLSNPTSNLEYPTLRPEGLTVLGNGHVYGAIGSEGIVKYDGNSWVLQNSGLSINNQNRQWTAVTGYVSGNNDVVYAGVNNTGGNANGENYSSIWRTVDGGDSWSALVDADANTVDTIYGQSIDWWYRVDAFPQAGLGRRNSIVSSIDVARGASAERVSDDIIYVSGRGGIWKSDNGGESWKPAVHNMQVTSNNDVVVNPNDPNQVVLANTDYVVLETSTGFEDNNVSRDKPGGAESKAYDATFDVISNEIILGVGRRDSNNSGGGEVFVKSASALGAPSGTGWTNTNLGSATSSADGRVRAVSSGYHNGRSATTQTILAAVEGEGVYRYHNGSWSKSSGITIGSTKRSNFVWPDSANSGVVYLLDLSSGLYRSNNGGQSWVDIWPGMSFRNKDFYNTGYITADHNNPTTLYVSIQADSNSSIGNGFNVYRMSAADTGVFGAPGTTGITDITKHSGDIVIQRPGPLVISPSGDLLLTQQQDSRNSIDAALFFMDNPANDSSFTELTTPEYSTSAVSPSGIDVSSDGHVYISQDGLGVVKISLP